MYTSKQIILALWIENSGNWEDIYKQVKAKKFPSSDALTEATKLDTSRYYAIGDIDYPNEYKSQEKPPFVIFKK